MGTPAVAPSYANLFMVALEEQLLLNAPNGLVTGRFANCQFANVPGRFANVSFRQLSVGRLYNFNNFGNPSGKQHLEFLFVQISEHNF